jgi:uncharacterized protein involved in exopolysaccharide biosynthesis
MNNQIYSLRSTSLRDGLSVVFRRKWLVILCVVATISAALLAALVLPRYHGEAKILVNRERVDPILSSTPEMGNFAQPVVTDEDLRSEVEIMRSTEVLTQVVNDMGLIHSGDHSDQASWWSRHLGSQKSDEEKTSTKVAQLSHDLVIEPAKGSYIIDIVYKSKDREYAKRVMNTLIQVYLAKHMAVQHPAGQFKFFEHETGEYRDRMAAAEARLAEFPGTSGTVAPAMDRELTMQKLAEFKFSLGQTRAAVAETEQRIQRLQQQVGSTPDRITTQSRRADNAQLLGQLKTSLLSLELKRAELLTKYQPDYRPVREIDQQIAQANADIQHELSSPMRDETTDLDATHQMVRSDLAKAQSDLAGYKARVQTTQNIVNSYSERARELDAKSLLQADLERTFKAEEDNYLLYRKKTEEARITDALDANRMLNIAVVEQPLVPGLPYHSGVFFFVLAFMTMTTASVGLIGSLEYLDRTFHTPRELEAYLDVPVLASIPRQLGPG